MAVTEPYPAGYPSAFVAFHDRHPEVYDRIVWHARLLKDRQYKAVGMRYLFEHERYHPTRDKDRIAGMEQGLNNNWSSLYGRLVEAQEEDLAGFFRCRTTRSERGAADANQGCLEFD